MTYRNDGKYLEKLLVDEFKKTKSLAFKWKRLRDAADTKSNRTGAQAADFIISRRGVGTSYIECKSRATKKLTLAKFAQLGEMRLWSKAGTPCYVLVHFHQISDHIYMVDVAKLEAGKSSWNISDIAIKFNSIKEAARWFYE